MLWSIDSCQKRVSADQYHMTVSLALIGKYSPFITQTNSNMTSSLRLIKWAEFCKTPLTTRWLIWFRSMFTGAFQLIEVTERDLAKNNKYEEITAVTMLNTCDPVRKCKIIQGSWANVAFSLGLMLGLVQKGGFDKTPTNPSRVFGGNFNPCLIS